ncbi:hypothetical protein BX666DRAFT_2119002 [Dichotomocladium elegans]|nr:hypothetical protein BX666DRAFT_2119002 [Dichotomocladium elegans]
MLIIELIQLPSQGSQWVLPRGFTNPLMPSPRSYKQIGAHAERPAGPEQQSVAARGMESVQKGFWFAVALLSTSAISAVALTVQRVYSHKAYRQQLETGPDPSKLHVDRQRDPSVPYADFGRIPRLTLETAILSLLAIYDLYVRVHSVSDEQQRSETAVFTVLTGVFVLLSWIYAHALALTARRYQLPNDWGFVLNCHIFVISAVALCGSIRSLYMVLRWSSNRIDTATALISFLLTADLTLVTATTKRGAPFLDEKGRRVSAINVSSVFGFFFFTWITPLIRLGYKKKLDDNDLPILPPEFRGYNLFYIFARSRGRGLLYRIFEANRLALGIQITLAFISSLLYYVPHYFTNQLLNVIQDVGQGSSREKGLEQGFLIVAQQALAVILLGLIVSQLWYWASSSLQVRIKSMLNIEIYRKTLRRMDAAVASGIQEEKTNGKGPVNDEKDDEDISSTGQIVNLMSTDSNRISEFATWWFSLIACPTELAIGIYFLYTLLGVSCFMGLSVMVIALPMNHFNAKLFAKTQDRLMEARDKRVSLMNEVLQGIRQIKFFASEKDWEKRIMASREVELGFLRTAYISEALFNLVWQGAPILVTALSFWSYTKLEGHELTAPVAFTSIIVFEELRFALNGLPETFIELLQALISVRRIQRYLDHDEIVPALPVDLNEPIRLGFEGATVTWPASSKQDNEAMSSSLSDDTRTENEAFLLKDLNLEFPNDKLSLICGKTGSGKTLLLLSLLGETVTSKGKVNCPRAPIAEDVSADFAIPESIPEESWIIDHGLAYVSQTAWLQNASIRDNITFGLPYVEKRYRATLYACALDKDMSIFEDGDMTEIGEKGITLSGGQKARVALARAVYSRAKNVLMDDVLSAVDAHTAKHLYRKCLLGPLMKDRTRILVTHHAKLCLNGADYLVHINGGRADIVGSPSELRQAGTLSVILDEEEENVDDIIEDEMEDVQDEQASMIELSAPRNDERKTPRVLIGEEQRATGMVKARLYMMYFKAVGSWWFWLGIIILVAGTRGFKILENWWIKKWTENTDTSNVLSVNAFDQPFEDMFPVYLSSFIPSHSSFAISSEKEDQNLNFYLGIYVAITFSSVIFSFLRFITIFLGGLRASRKLYGQLLTRVFRAPLRFFDTTPLGRILNRFSKDFETVDASIPNDMMQCAITIATVISIVMVAIFSLPMFTLPMLTIIALNIFVSVMFVATSRELKRIDSVSRSPLFSHFSETIIGVATIRAFGVTRQFMQDMLKRVDANSRPFYYVWTVNRWVSLRYSLLGAMIGASTGVAILLNLDRMDAAAAGFCLSFILALSDNMFWGIRRYTNVEMSFNAVERIVEFTEMDEEAPAITDIRPPSKWPMEGRVQVRDLEVRYAPELDPVLHGISFEVKPREKIGIVGRTGSGKSTLALSFFRFVEATRGSIVIDGIDIKDIGTEDLRSSLTIIPQDPTLFSGTLRSNMDPFEQFSDDEIFTALRRVHLLPSEHDFDMAALDTVNANVFLDLHTPVSEGGKNFSQGQRQLLCLARALLKRSKLVMMDEATASVDFNTDKAIQKTIAMEFAESSILCIAHRLHTVIEYDRILVLDQGRVVEFASPLDLISNQETIFHKMCRNSGEFDSLLALAKAKHQLVDV